MEEVAYTWFNRLIALRFMEVNGYLPTRVRVFTDEENNFKPQIIDEALHLDLDGLNMDKVYEFKNANQTEELYKYLLITQCNALNSVLPGMFQRISDYTELLLPDNLLREGSVIEQMISTIPEEDWRDAVQIIGWLYQYYNAEKKDEVFAALKKNVKITKENIPAATQLFTPDWIVRYMVENSLGRLWVEGHPNDELKSGWKYYLEEAKQEPEVQAQLAEIRKEYAAMTPEQIKCIDPCCGSGHILAYLFDVLVQIYESYGYTTREAVESIMKNNLYGLDIDDRAAQLAYFAVMMKARQYDRRFFSRQIQPNVYAIQESNGVDRYALEYFCNGDAKLKAVMDSIIKEMHDAKEYGSILNITPVDFAALYARFDEVQDDISMSKESVLNNLLPLVQVAEALAQKYDVVVTNPPYMGSPNMSDKLLSFIKEQYPDGKADIYAAFIGKCLKMSATNRYVSMITQSTWMYQSRLEELRHYLRHYYLVNMMHLGTRAFDSISGEVVQTTAFVYQKGFTSDKANTTFVRLVDYKSEADKAIAFSDNSNIFIQQVANFDSIPGIPFAYYLSQNAFADFKSGIKLKNVLNPKQGTSTGNDELFVRSWFEVNSQDIGFAYSSTQQAHESGKKYFPLDKGGEYRKWYGDNERIIMFNESSYTKLLDMGNHLPSRQYYFLPGLTWSKIASELSVRYDSSGFVFSSVGLKGFPSKENSEYCLAFLNSKVCSYFLGIISPGISIVSGDIEKLPLIPSNDPCIQKITEQCISICQSEWDSYEISWDFTKHPLIRPVSTVVDAFAQWQAECNNRFAQLKANEEELNRIFIDIYGLQDELTPEVEDKDVTVRKADLQRDIKSLISYAVGCMFGRYSPLKDGLLYAGGNWDYTAIQQELMDAIGKNEFSSGDMVWNANFIDKDNIIPICDDEYFDDDIVGRFVKFIEAVYGKDTLEENLKFIADALGGKGQPREVIRNYFLNDFYADHCKICKGQTTRLSLNPFLVHT